MGGLLHLVQRGEAWAGLAPARVTGDTPWRHSPTEINPLQKIPGGNLNGQLGSGLRLVGRIGCGVRVRCHFSNFRFKDVAAF